MIVLFTDFGNRGPYVGQMRAVLEREAASVSVIELMNDAPKFDPVASAHLLAAYVHEFPAGTVFLAVVDPGVGSEQRKPIVFQVDGCWFVGPGNGLFDVLASRGREVQCWEITWRPENLSNSFHGRDLFAPVAAKLAKGESPPGTLIETIELSLSADDLSRIIYIDSFGNAITGLRAEKISVNAKLKIGKHLLSRKNTFSDVVVGQAFWHENANGLIELAVNQGHAADVLMLTQGDEVVVVNDE